MTFVVYQLLLPNVPENVAVPAVGAVLRKAAEQGVHILAYDCVVTADEMKIDKRIEVCL